MEKKKIIEKRAEAHKRVRQLIEHVKLFAEPLKAMTKEQKSAAIAVGLFVDCLVSAKHPVIKMPKKDLELFAKELDDLCPGIGSATLSRGECLERTVAYLSAIDKCSEKGITEDECLDARARLGGTLICAMEKIEKMVKIIGQLHDLPNHLVPPPPPPPPQRIHIR